MSALQAERDVVQVDLRAWERDRAADVFAHDVARCLAGARERKRPDRHASLLERDIDTSFECGAVIVGASSEGGCASVEGRVLGRYSLPGAEIADVRGRDR